MSTGIAHYPIFGTDIVVIMVQQHLSSLHLWHQFKP